MSGHDHVERPISIDVYKFRLTWIVHHVLVDYWGINSSGAILHKHAYGIVIAQ